VGGAAARAVGSLASEVVGAGGGLWLKHVRAMEDYDPADGRWRGGGGGGGGGGGADCAPEARAKL
jgi:hypothetical protein